MILKLERAEHSTGESTVDSWAKSTNVLFSDSAMELWKLRSAVTAPGDGPTQVVPRLYLESPASALGGTDRVHCGCVSWP